MEYKVIYSGETKDINDVHTISLEIYKYTDEEVTVKELTLGVIAPLLLSMMVMVKYLNHLSNQHAQSKLLLMNLC